MSSVPSAAGLLRGRISIITGSSSGLGRATALAFARQGASVVCADRFSSLPSQLQVPTHELIGENGGESAFFSTDVADAQSVQNLVRSAAKEFGRLDMCVTVVSPLLWSFYLPVTRSMRCRQLILCALRISLSRSLSISLCYLSASRF